MIKLYQFENCPYCEKTRLALEEKGLPYQKIEVPYHRREEVVRLSGQNLVPVIVDGEVIGSDSPLIADYLEEKYPARPASGAPSGPTAPGWWPTSRRSWLRPASTCTGSRRRSWGRGSSCT